MHKASLYQELSYSKERPLISVLLETDFTKEIRIAMGEGTSMKEHQAPYPIVVEVVEGDIDFGVEGRIEHLSKGSLIALEGSTPHDLKANVDSVIRLTLAKLDKSERVKKLASS